MTGRGRRCSWRHWWSRPRAAGCPCQAQARPWPAMRPVPTPQWAASCLVSSTARDTARRECSETGGVVPAVPRRELAGSRPRESARASPPARVLPRAPYAPPYAHHVWPQANGAAKALRQPTAGPGKTSATHRGPPIHVAAFMGCIRQRRSRGWGRRAWPRLFRPALAQARQRRNRAASPAGKHGVHTRRVSGWRGGLAAGGAMWPQLLRLAPKYPHMPRGGARCTRARARLGRRAGPAPYRRPQTTRLMAASTAAVIRGPLRLKPSAAMASVWISPWVRSCVSDTIQRMISSSLDGDTSSMDA